MELLQTISLFIQWMSCSKHGEERRGEDRRCLYVQCLMLTVNSYGDERRKQVSTEHSVKLGIGRPRFSQS